MRTISAINPTNTIQIVVLGDCSIRVFRSIDNVAGAPSRVGPRANCPSYPPLSVALFVDNLCNACNSSLAIR